MKRIPAALAFSLAAVLSVSAFAESPAGDSPGAGPGNIAMGRSGAQPPWAVTPDSAMSGAVAASSAGMRAADAGPMLARAPSTVILGSPPSSSTTVVTQTYWNVPANVQSRSDFQRWLRLR